MRDIEIAIGTKLHAHRCHRIDVSVSYNNATVTYEYAPSATIARIEHHVAVKGFGLSEEAAAEHVLQIKGMTVQPSPGTHVGSLVQASRLPYCLRPRAEGARPGFLVAPLLMTPDERALEGDLKKAAFLLGVAGQKWRLERGKWPKVFIAVRARDGRWFVLRFDCTNYPVTAPTACP